MVPPWARVSCAISDLKLRAHSEAGPLGFYQTYRNLIRVDQQIYSGGKAFAHYRLGRGVYQPWYLERQTNEGGEFLAGFEVPLKQNRTIDKQRQQLWLASLTRAQVEPEIQTDIIEFTRQASYAYWEWIAAGELLRIAESLLDFAETREDALERLAEEGDRPAIDVVDNKRLITLRDAKRIDAERKLQQSALQLSLYLRNPDGTTRVVSRKALPDGFPVADRDLDQQEEPAVDQPAGSPGGQCCHRTGPLATGLFSSRNRLSRRPGHRAHRFATITELTPYLG